MCGHGKTVDAFKTSLKEKAPHLSTVRHFPRPPRCTLCVCAGPGHCSPPSRPSVFRSEDAPGGWLATVRCRVWCCDCCDQQQHNSSCCGWYLNPAWPCSSSSGQSSSQQPAASTLPTLVTIMKLIPTTATLLPFLLINSVMAQEVRAEIIHIIQLASDLNAVSKNILQQ